MSTKAKQIKVKSDMKSLMLQLKKAVNAATKKINLETKSGEKNKYAPKLIGRMGKHGAISTRLPDHSVSRLCEIEALLGSLLNLNVSRNVLISRAISCYYSYLMDHILEGICLPDPQEALEALVERLDDERSDVFIAAGRKDSK